MWHAGHAQAHPPVSMTTSFTSCARPRAPSPPPLPCPPRAAHVPRCSACTAARAPPCTSSSKLNMASSSGPPASAAPHAPSRLAVDGVGMGALAPCPAGAAVAVAVAVAVAGAVTGECAASGAGMSSRKDCARAAGWPACEDDAALRAGGGCVFFEGGSEGEGLRPAAHVHAGMHTHASTHTTHAPARPPVQLLARAPLGQAGPDEVQGPKPHELHTSPRAGAPRAHALHARARHLLRALHDHARATDCAPQLRHYGV